MNDKPVEIGIVILHDKAEFVDRMKVALVGCTSLCLHALIKEVPEAAIARSGITGGAMRSSCRYADRWQTTPVSYPNNPHVYHQRCNPPVIGAKFEKTLETILDNVSPHRLLEIMAEYNEIKAHRIKITASKMQ